MNSNDWQQIGEDIKKQVQSAIDANDFSELSRTISETVGQAIDDVGKSVSGVFQQTIQKKPHFSNTTGSDTAGAGNKTDSRQPWKGEVYYGKPNLRPDRRYFVRRPKGSISGVLQIIFGFGTAVLTGFAFCMVLMGTLFSGDGSLGVSIFGGICGILAAAGAALGIRGICLTERADRFKRYAAMLQEKLYCSIEDMAASMGKSRKFILKDLRKMMHKGWFLQGHIDKQESCFIASDQVFEQYRLTQKNYEEEQKKKEESLTETVNEVESESLTEYDKILEEGRDYIQAIRFCNDEIPGEEMSEKLDKLELLVTRIFAQVEKEPELAPELHKMLNYYLPTTQKLLEAYRDLEKQNVEVSNISKTKKEIEAAVDTINLAFEKFLDELFREKAWDIQTDISVLNTMLKQDGYLKGDFENKENG